MEERCSTCEKPPSEYARQLREFREGVCRCYVPRLIAEFHANNQLFELCAVCGEGTQSARQHSERPKGGPSMASVLTVQIRIPVPRERPEGNAQNTDWRRAIERQAARRRPSSKRKKGQKRNDKCACGSGKKFKRCCAVRHAANKSSG
jgi:hypothetical protein